MARKVPIFAYHRVHLDDDVTVENDLGRINLSVFRQQIEYLTSEGVSTVTQCDIADWLYDGKALPERCVALDFHDNRLNVLENAYPLLAERGMRATVTVITDLADGKDVFRPDDFPAMNWQQLGQMRDAGWCITPHTCRHTHLAGPDRMPQDDQVIWTELRESRRIVAERMGVDSPYFAYPSGSWNHRIEAMVKEVYRTALHWHRDMSTDEWPLTTERINPYRLSGINVASNMPLEIFCKIVDLAC